MKNQISLTELRQAENYYLVDEIIHELNKASDCWQVFDACVKAQYALMTLSDSDTCPVLSSVGFIDAITELTNLQAKLIGMYLDDDHFSLAKIYVSNCVNYLKHQYSIEAFEKCFK